MKNKDANHPDPKIFHVGTKTHAFDALDQDLLVAAYEEDVGQATVEELTGLNDRRMPASLPQEPISRQGSSKKGYLAFKARSDAVYRIQGVEYIPVHRVRYLRFDKKIGYRELTLDETLAILAKRDEESASRQKNRPCPDDPASWPRLKGKHDDIRKAEAIRLRVRDMLITKSPGRLDNLLWHSYARWYLRYEHLTDSEWIAMLGATDSTNDGERSELDDQAS